VNEKKAVKSGPGLLNTKPASSTDRVVLWTVFALTAATTAVAVVLGMISAIVVFVERSYSASLVVGSIEKLPPQAMDGNVDVTGRYDTALVEVAGLQDDTSLLVLVSALVWVLIWGIVFGSVAYLAWQLLKRKPFAAPLTAAIMKAGSALAAGSISAQLLSGFAQWHVIGEMTGNAPVDSPWFWALEIPIDFAPIGAGILLLLVGLAFRHGERLQRDTDGLV